MINLKSGFRKLDKKLIVKYSGEKMILPKDIQTKVDKYWEKLINSGKDMWRGEGYHVVNIEEEKNKIEVALVLSDYAHYVFSRHKGLSLEYSFKNIHTSCLIESSDDILIFGVMGKQTSMAGNVQCVGGGLDNSDLMKNEFNLLHNIKKELEEEVVIDTNDNTIVKSLNLEYINYNEKLNEISVIYILKLKISAAQFKEQYELFEEKLTKEGKFPEFGKIIYLKRNKKDIEDFINKINQPHHYIESLLLARVSG